MTSTFLFSLLSTALLMGLLGGPHCLVMCGAVCGGIATQSQRGTWALAVFQIGRVVGYSALGALAAASIQGVGWLTIQSSAFRPVWSMFHALVLVLGLFLLLRGVQPIWLEEGAKRLWQRVRDRVSRLTHHAPHAFWSLFLLGVVWALLPCGLLYAALLTAAMAATPLAGAAVMAVFVLGTSVTLMATPWLMRKIGASKAIALRGVWGLRLAGLALVASSSAALYLGLMHDQAPWCITV